MGTGPAAAWARLRPELARRFAIDPRALAAYRIAIAAVVLVDLLAFRAPELATFYTDAGVLPRSVLAETAPVAARVSLHTVTGSLAGQAVLLGLTAVAAGGLLVGYRTRWAAVATWILLASMQARNPQIVNAGDTLVLATLFFGLFLPLGERWSIDRVRRSDPDEEGPVVSAATVGLFIQVVVVYATNLAFKLGTDAWLDGDAVAVVFALDDYTVGLGDALAQFGPFLSAANWVWLAALACSPLLIVLAGWARAGLVAVFAILHLGMLATLMLGVFPLVSIAGLLVFLPAEALDRIEARLPGAGPTGSRSAPTARGLSRPLQAGLGALIVVGLAWHGMALGLVPEPAVVEEAGHVGNHRWEMFAPPTRTYGYVEAPANLTEAGTVDALRLGASDGEPPAEMAEAYPSTMWHRYLTGLAERSTAEYAALADHLCRRVAESYGPVDTVAIVVVQHEVRLDGPDPVERRPLHSQPCPA